MRASWFWVVALAVTGCDSCDEDDPGTLVDAPGGADGATSDGAVIDGAPSTDIVARVRIGVPNEGLVVHFQRPDGSLVLTTQTDANGEARVAGEPGLFVTVEIPSLPLHPTAEAITVADAQIGDVIEFGHLPLAQTTATIVPPTPRPDTESVVVHGCRTTVEESIDSLDQLKLQAPQCAPPLDVVVLTRATDGELAFEVNATGQTPANGMLDLSTLVWQPLARTTLGFIGLGGATNFAAHVSRGSDVLQPAYTQEHMFPSGQANYSVSAPSPTDLETSYVESFLRNGANHGRYERWPGDDPNPTHGVDFTEVGFSIANAAYSASTGEVSWTHPPGAQYSLVVGGLSFRRQVGNTSIRGVRRMAGRFDGSFVIPKLPVAPGGWDYNPLPTDTLETPDLLVAWIGSKAGPPGSFDMIRERIFAYALLPGFALQTLQGVVEVSAL